MLSPLRDPVTALLKPSSGFHLRAEAETLTGGQGALHPLTSQVQGNFIIPACPLIPAHWPPGSSLNMPGIPLLWSLRLECSFPLASTWLASFWFLLKCHFGGVYGAGDQTQRVVHAS